MTFREFTPSDIGFFEAWLNKEYIKKWYNDPEDWLLEVKSDDFTFIHHFIVQPDDDNSASRNTLLSAGFQLDTSNNIFVLMRGDVCR